jgi:phosphatidate cytidylyltransferase
MSYLDPRAGQTSGDDTSVPAPAWHAAEDAATGPLPVVAPVTESSDKKANGRRRAKGGRAGRNLPAAIGVGFGLALVVLGSLTLWPPAFFGVIVLASGVGVWEMTRAMRAGGADAPVIPLLGGTVLITALAWFSGTDAMLLGLAATILAAILWRIADGAAAFKRDLTASILIAVYVPFLLGFGILLFLPDTDNGQWRVLCTMLAVILSDTGGYATGVFLGRHKMAPSISPGKTWEGFAGSVCASAIGSALLLYFLLDIPAYWGLLFGAVLSVVAVVGDLAESMLKRDLGIKDMSNLLPGHGGVMDRLDSILFAVPTAYLLYAVIAWAS